MPHRIVRMPALALTMNCRFRCPIAPLNPVLPFRFRTELRILFWQMLAHEAMTPLAQNVISSLPVCVAFDFDWHGHPPAF